MMKKLVILPLLLSFTLACSKQEAHEPAKRAVTEVKAAADQVENKAKTALDDAIQARAEKKPESWQKPSAATFSKKKRGKRSQN